MKQEMIEKVMPYLLIWSGIIVIVISTIALHIWLLSRKNSKILNTTNKKSKYKKRISDEFQRRFNNRMIFIFVVIFIWMIGTVLICCDLKLDESSVSLLILFVFVAFLSLTRIERKKAI